MADHGAIIRRYFRNLILISDYIEEFFAESRLFHILNHPTINPLVELAKRVLNRMGCVAKNNIPNKILSDFELLGAWYPENPFIPFHGRNNNPVKLPSMFGSAINIRRFLGQTCNLSGSRTASLLPGLGTGNSLYP